MHSVFGTWAGATINRRGTGADLVEEERRVAAYDGPGREVDPLAHQVATDPAGLSHTARGDQGHRVAQGAALHRNPR